MKTETTITEDNIIIKLTPEDTTDEFVRQALGAVSSAVVKINGGIAFVVERPKQKLGKFVSKEDKGVGNGVE